MPDRSRNREIVATITGPNGWFYPYHASYRVGVGLCESGSLAWTRRGIERKARRVIRRLERQQRAQREATHLKAEA